MIAAIIRAALALTGLVALATAAPAEAPFTTRDPLRAFVGEHYNRGNDYFIHGRRGTMLLRCVLTRRNAPFPGVAYSEQSIWGNGGGPWELFRRQTDGRYVFVGTKWLADLSCLQSCRSDDYLRGGRCRWHRGWISLNDAR